MWLGVVRTPMEAVEVTPFVFFDFSSGSLEQSKALHPALDLRTLNTLASGTIPLGLLTTMLIRRVVGVGVEVGGGCTGRAKPSHPTPLHRCLRRLQQVG